MGGCSVLVMLGVMAAAGAAVLAATFAGYALLLAGIIVSIVFVARTKHRQEQGKTLGGLVVLPIVLVVVGLIVVLWVNLEFWLPIFMAE